MLGHKCSVLGPKNPKTHKELHKMPINSIVVLVMSSFSNCNAVESQAHIFCQPRKLTDSSGKVATAAKAQDDSLSVLLNEAST